METTEITQKYVRKPLYVAAVQVTKSNFEDLAKWCQGEIRNIDESPVNKALDVDPDKQYIHVRVHNPKNPRQTKAHVGDWILYTERGYKVYTEKAFKSNFDKLDEDGVMIVGGDDHTDEDNFGSFLTENQTQEG
jgi:trehalose-6-phosphatase